MSQTVSKSLDRLVEDELKERQMSGRVEGDKGTGYETLLRSFLQSEAWPGRSHAAFLRILLRVEPRVEVRLWA